MKELKIGLFLVSLGLLGCAENLDECGDLLSPQCTCNHVLRVQGEQSCRVHEEASVHYFCGNGQKSCYPHARSCALPRCCDIRGIPYLIPQNSAQLWYCTAARSIDFMVD